MSNLAPAEAQAVLRAALLQENERQSVLLSAVRNPRREVTRSTRGNSLAWTDGPQFVYWFGGRFERIALPGNPIAFGLSPGGSFAAVVFRSGSECVARRLDLERKELSQARTSTDCQGRPAVTDDGKSLYVARGPYLHRTTSVDQDLHRPDERTRAAGPFAVPYRRLSPNLYVYALDGERVLLLAGTGGYYDAHIISTGGSRLLGRGFSSRMLFDALSVVVPPLNEAGPSARPPRTQPTGALPVGHLLAGGSGQLRLIALLFQNGRAELGTATPVPHSSSYASVPGSGILLIRDERASLQSAPGLKGQLPILMKRFHWFPDGMVYEDPAGRLRLRRTLPTAAEYRIDSLLAALRARQPAEDTAPPR